MGIEQREVGLSMAALVSGMITYEEANGSNTIAERLRNEVFPIRDGENAKDIGDEIAHIYNQEALNVYPSPEEVKALRKADKLDLLLELKLLVRTGGEITEEYLNNQIYKLGRDEF